MFACEGLRATWQGYVEPGYCNNCAIRLASDLGLFGLSENEAKDKLFEWNERNGIKLPSDEVRNFVVNQRSIITIESSSLKLPRYPLHEPIGGVSSDWGYARSAEISAQSDEFARG